MIGACPTPASDAPMAPSLLALADCQVGRLAEGGYHALFAAGGHLAGLLTGLLTVFVAVIGFQLMLGRSDLRLNEIVMSAVKLGAVLTLATQWDVYQRVVFTFLFLGPQELASQLDAAVGGASAQDVIVHLQGAFDSLSAAAAAYGDHVSGQASPLAGGAGLGALLLNVSATALIMSSLGVLLAAKVVLGALLALGPIFIALFLFEATRGLCEGWIRASLAFALSPLAVTLLLSVNLAMMDPALAMLAETLAKKQYTLGPVYAVLVIALVFAVIVLGAVVACVMVATGLRLPRPMRGAVSSPSVVTPQTASAPPPPREAQLSRIVSNLDRRERVGFALPSQGTLAPAPLISPRAQDLAPGWAGERQGAGTRRAIAPKSASTPERASR